MAAVRDRGTSDLTISLTGARGHGESCHAKVAMEVSGGRARLAVDRRELKVRTVGFEQEKTEVTKQWGGSLTRHPSGKEKPRFRW